MKPDRTIPCPTCGDKFTISYDADGHAVFHESCHKQEDCWLKEQKKICQMARGFKGVFLPALSSKKKRPQRGGQAEAEG